MKCVLLLLLYQGTRLLWKYHKLLNRREEWNTKIAILIWLVKFSSLWIDNFFLFGFLSQALTIQRTAREGRGHLCSSLPIPSSREQSDIYLQLWIWNDQLVFLIVLHVVTRLLLNEIYPPLWISIWLNVIVF